MKISPLPVFLCIVLTVANTGRASQSQCVEEKATASMRWVKPTRQVPRIISQSVHVDQAFMLLARGYQETGSCIKLIGLHAQRARKVLEKLKSPQLPIVIINLAVEYFASTQTSEEIEQEFGDNLWVLFEQHVGDPAFYSPKPCSILEVSKGFSRRVTSGIKPSHASLHLTQAVIKSCLDDLQKLTEMGHAYNPYECNTSDESSRLRMVIPTSGDFITTYDTSPAGSFSWCGAVMKQRYTKKDYEQSLLIPLLLHELLCTVRLEEENPYFSGKTEEEFVIHLRGSDGRDRYYGENGYIHERDIKLRGGQFAMHAMLYRRIEPQHKIKPEGTEKPRCSSLFRCIIS